MIHISVEELKDIKARSYNEGYTKGMQCGLNTFIKVLDDKVDKMLSKKRARAKEERVTNKFAISEIRTPQSAIQN